MTTYPLNNIEYTAEDAELFHCTRRSGIFSLDDFKYSVSGEDNKITINEGISFIRNTKFSGKVAAQKEPVSIDLGVADSVYSRVDAVVIQFDKNANKTEIILKNGTAATSPEPPEVVRTELVYELHLYHVLREPGELTISDSNVTDIRNIESYCGIMTDGAASVELDDTLSISGKAADAAAVGNKFKEIPITKTEDGYTDIEGLRRPVGMEFTKDGDTVTATVTLEGGEVSISVIALNENGYPASVVTDGVECIIDWAGFDDTTGGGDTGGGGTVEGATYFYNAGDACEDITGGWEDIHSKSTLTLNADNMTIFGNEATYCLLCLRTKNTVDISSISKLYFDILYTGPLTSGQTAVGATQDASFDADTDFAAMTAMTENTARTTVEVDVSGLTGAYYIGLFGYSYAEDQNTGYTVYNVWGE